jgi:hypothetical protein
LDAEKIFLPPCKPARSQKKNFYPHANLQGPRKKFSTLMQLCMGTEKKFLPSCKFAWAQKKNFYPHANLQGYRKKFSTFMQVCEATLQGKLKINNKLKIENHE